MPAALFDNAATSNYEPALSTYNFNLVIANQPDRCLVVGVDIFAAGTVSSVTAGGVNLSFIRADLNSVYRSELWRLVNSATGTVNIVVTLSTSLTSITNAQSYYNVDQSAPIEANNGNTGTNTPASASLTPKTSGGLVVGTLAASSASGVTSHAGQNSRTASNGAIGTGASDDKGPNAAPPVSTTLQWDGLGALDTWAVSLAALRPTIYPSQFVPVAPVQHLRAEPVVAY